MNVIFLNNNIYLFVAIFTLCDVIVIDILLHKVIALLISVSCKTPEATFFVSKPYLRKV